MSVGYKPEPLPPHDIAAEEAVLGSLLIDSACIIQIRLVVTAADFFRERNRWVWEAACRVAASGRPTDPVLVAHQIAEDGHLDDLGGCAYLSGLILATPTSVHAQYYARLVHDLAERRRAMAQGAAIVRQAYEGTGLQIRRRDLGRLGDNR